MKKIKHIKKKLLLVSTLAAVTSCTIAASLIMMKNDTVLTESSNTYTLTISSFSWKNTYYCYATTKNGNKLSFTRKSSWNTKNFNYFVNSTKIHYIKSITATFSTTGSVKVGWNKVVQTESYKDVPEHGTGENAYYSYANLSSGVKYTFSYSKVYYFVIFDQYNDRDLGLSRLVIAYNC